MASEKIDFEHHWLIFTLSERGHLHPQLPLIAELKRGSLHIKTTIILTVWEESVLPMCQKLIGDTKPQEVEEGEEVVNPTVVTLDELSSWKWEGEPHPHRNLPTLLGTGTEVLAYCRSLVPRPTAVFYDPFHPTAVLVAQELDIPLLCTVSFTPNDIQWHKADDIDRVREKFAVDLGPDRWAHSHLQFVMKHAKILQFSVPTVLSSILPSQVIDQSIFCGSSITHTRATVSETENQAVIDIEAAKARGHTAVFFSLGTVMQKSYNTEASFREFIDLLFTCVFHAVKQRPATELFVAANGFQLDLESPTSPFYQLAPEIHIYDWVPQLRMLPFCDLFISHGGANSFHEAISSAVPLILVPFWGDQFTNAKIVNTLKIGVSFDHDEGVPLVCGVLPQRKSLTPERMVEAFQTVLDPALKSRVVSLADEFKSFTFSRAIPQIQSWIEQQLSQK